MDVGGTAANTRNHPQGIWCKQEGELKMRVDSWGAAGGESSNGDRSCNPGRERRGTRTRGGNAGSSVRRAQRAVFEAQTALLTGCTHVRDHAFASLRAPLSHDTRARRHLI
eukprot:4751246-Pleurochrysis_carterae.AAC.1